MTDTVEEFVVQLGEKLDIAKAEELHHDLEDALASNQTIRLDGDQVVKMDTAGVQVLSAFCEEAKKLHLEVGWKDPSDTLFQIFGFLGLTESVGLNDQEQKA